MKNRFTIMSIIFSVICLIFLAAAPASSQVLFLGDDDFAEVSMPFSFPFAGTSYNSVFVGSNGFITFGSGNTDFSESPVDLLLGPPRIAALWDDLNPDTSFSSGSISTATVGSDFVITYDNIPEFNNAGSVNTFTITLRSNGTFKIAYGTISVLDGLAGRTPGNADGGDPGEIDLSAAAQPIGSGIAAMVYENFDLDDNDLTSLSLEFAAAPAPSGSPDINVSPASLSFSIPEGGSDDALLTISNTAAFGSPALEWSITEQEVTLVMPDGRQLPVKFRPKNPELSFRQYRELPLSAPDSKQPDTPLGAKHFMADIPKNPAGTFPPTEDVTLVLDDGLIDNNIGLTSGGQFLWLNRFTPNPADFPFTLDEIWVMFGAGVGVNVGELVDIYVFEDTDGDGNPGTGANHLYSLNNAAVQFTDDVTFSKYPISPGVTLNGPGDVLIAVVNRTAGIAAGTFVAAIDQTSSAQRSWVGIYTATPPDPPTLPADAFFGLIDNAGPGLAGNWMVRGFEGTPPADVPWIFETPVAGVTAPQSFFDVFVAVDAAGLVPGTYNCNLLVGSNDPDENPVTVPVSLTVTAAVAPDILVWVGPDAIGASAASADSLFDAIAANGESVFVTDDLFQFGANLDQFSAIFVVLGIFPNNHVIAAGDPEGPALEAYLAGGGNLYLEGGDCFNYDPVFGGGYNIPPWFSLNAGGDGSADLFGITGLNDLAGFAFAYAGENNWMDELAPNLSTPVWQNDANADLSGVFYSGFGGKSIGVVPSFGGLVDSPSPLRPETAALRHSASRESQTMAEKVRPPREVQAPFAKRYAYHPELKRERSRENPLYKVTPQGLEIMANTKVDLMAAYLDFFFGGACITGLLGDINGDNAVNSLDALLMLSYDAGLPLPQPFLDRIAIGFGDVTEDGLTNSTDALVTLSWEVGFPVPFPVGTTVCLPVAAPLGKSTLPAAAQGSEVQAYANLNFSGQTLEVPVMIDMANSGEKLGSYTMSLTWNPALLEFTGFSGGNTEGFADPVVNDLNARQGRLVAAHAYPQGAGGEVNVLNARFLVKGNVEALPANPLTLNFSAMAAARSFTDLLPAVKVSDAIAGAPASFALDNYPNPFNPATEIRYQLPEAVDVQIVVYNLLGQKVQTLVNGKQAAGTYTVRWEGVNEQNQAVPSGMYFLRMKAGKFVADRKLMLLK